jgi:uncharacterized membrane protein YfcA
MFVGALPLVWRLSIVFVAGVAAGIANGVAGGGTFFTFPTLLSLGVPALTANISTTVGVVPSYLGSLRVFRVQLRPHKKLLASLVPSILLGTALGTALLLNGSAGTFRSVVPWLIGGGTALFAVSPYVTKRLAHIGSEHRGRRWALFVGIFAVSIYGGYFGAGMGILLLAVMAVALPFEIHELQGLRNAISIVINVVAALIFVVHGHLAWKYVAALLIGTLIGGYLGALLLVRLSPLVVRILVIAIGVATTIKLALG